MLISRNTLGGFFLLSMCFVHVCSEVFTALADLEKVVQAEKYIARDLRSYVAMEQARLQLLARIADDYDEHSEEVLSQDAEAYVGNPLNAFLLVKRFTYEWEKVENLIKNNTSDAFLSSISGTLSSFPDEDDLKGAARALLRLQDTYALPTSSLANGEIQGIKKSPVLSAGDCFHLGQVAYNGDDYYHTILWMAQALEKIDNETEPTADRSMTLDYISYAAYVQGNIELALNYTLDWLELEPDNERAKGNIEHYQSLLSDDQEHAPCSKAEDVGRRPAPENIKNERNLDAYHSSSEFADYEAMCRGDPVFHNPHKHKLTCQYRSHHPFFILAPLKEEQMYINPGVWMYHQLMTNKEIARIKELAMPKLHRSGVFLTETVTKKEQEYRTSKSAWLSDWEDPILSTVSQKTAAMANLTLDYAEQFQVLNYGIGGHYEPHWDFAREEEKAAIDPVSGNRIATAIYYLSDVEAGGATVFTQFAARVMPEKGSVALWYNLLKNGQGDFRTQHAGCPVLTGSKWVCNKWFHERAQEFIRPCTTDPNE